MAASASVENISLSGEIAAEETLTGQIALDLSSGSTSPPYEGDYQVTPGVGARELETKGKRMSKNIEIEPIPLSCVSNGSGGKTVTIG